MNKSSFLIFNNSRKRYIQFAQNLVVELQQIKRGKHKEIIYHIQHINAFHSKLKKWIAPKYLANYMY